MSITYDRKRFWDRVRGPVFAGRLTESQVSGNEAILAGWEKHLPAGDARQLGNCCGTAFWETARTMQPIEEYGHGRGRSYGKPTGPYGQIYYGRGLVQLTFDGNYRNTTLRLRKLGVLTAAEDLERTPSLALRPDVAVAIMIFGMAEGWFTGKKSDDYFHGATADWTGARRIINGTDHAAEIGAISQHFYAALHVAAVTAPAAKLG